MDNDFAALFDDLPRASSCTKRTYSSKTRGIAAMDDSGLMTPPSSSSPPTSPLPVRISTIAVPSAKRLCQSEPTARSITALLEKSGNVRTAKPKIAKSKDKKGLVQMHLNLRPAHVTCKECGMSFTRTSASDTALHNSFHSSQLLGIPLSSTLTLADGMHRLSYTKTNERNMMRKCTNIVDLELSASLAPLDAGFVGYIMVKASRVQSFLLVQPIEKARVLHEQSGEEGEEIHAVMGVSRMWTCRRARGQGKVRQVLDFALQDFVQGCTLTKDEVAFTQLSESGTKTCKKWHPKGPLLVYRD